MAEFIVMRHPETSGVAETTQEAFDMVWSGKGWEETDSSALIAAQAGAADLSELSVEQLRQIAAARGVGVEGRATKAKLIDALSQEG